MRVHGLPDGETARDNVLLAMEQLSGFSEERESKILENEDKLDTYEDRLGSYLVEVSQHGVSMTDIRTVPACSMPSVTSERIGDHAINIRETPPGSCRTRSCTSPPLQKRNSRS